MAFVRWRKNCAELLATVYEGDRSRLVLLACLPNDHVPLSLREEVTRRFPALRIDWHAIDMTLARGPRQRPAPPKEHTTWAEVEHHLRQLAWSVAQTRGWTKGALALAVAADVLTAWRAGGVLLRTPEAPGDTTPAARRGRANDPSDTAAMSSADPGKAASRGPPAGTAVALPK